MQTRAKGTHEYTHLALISIRAEQLTVPCVLDKISPSTPEDRVLIFAGYRAPFEAKACIEGNGEDVEEPVCD